MEKPQATAFTGRHSPPLPTTASVSSSFQNSHQCLPLTKPTRSQSPQEPSDEIYKAAAFQGKIALEKARKWIRGGKQGASSMETNGDTRCGGPRVVFNLFRFTPFPLTHTPLGTYTHTLLFSPFPLAVSFCILEIWLLKSVPWVFGQESTPGDWSQIYFVPVSWSLQVLSWT